MPRERPRAAEAAQRVELVLGLDAFGDDGELQRLGELDDRGHDRFVASVADPGQEGAVDLEDVERNRRR